MQNPSVALHRNAPIEAETRPEPATVFEQSGVAVARWDRIRGDVCRSRYADSHDGEAREATEAGEGLFVSTDAGASFEGVEPLAGTYVHGIHFDPSNPERVYAYVAADEPLYRSDDGGESWRPIGRDLPAARPADNLVVGDEGTLFYAGDAGDGESRLFVSNDAGDTWTRLDGALPKVWRLYSSVCKS